MHGQTWGALFYGLQLSKAECFPGLAALLAECLGGPLSYIGSGHPVEAWEPAGCCRLLLRLSEDMGDLWPFRRGCAEGVHSLKHPTCTHLAPWQSLQPAVWLGHQVEFKDVTFSYPTRPDVVALRKVNLMLRPGRVMALVGLSGSGKSTLVSLLERLYDVGSGQVAPLKTLALQNVNVQPQTLNSERSSPSCSGCVTLGPGRSYPKTFNFYTLNPNLYAFQLAWSVCITLGPARCQP